MSELVRDIGQYLIDQAIARAFGEDIFLNFTPDDPSNIIVLTEYQGDTSILGDVSLLRRLQVLVRGDEYEVALQRIWSIYNAFIKDDEFIIYPNANRYLIPSAVQAPVFLMVDDKERRVFVFNLALTTIKDY